MVGLMFLSAGLVLLLWDQIRADARDARKLEYLRHSRDLRILRQWK